METHEDQKADSPLIHQDQESARSQGQAPLTAAKGQKGAQRQSEAQSGDGVAGAQAFHLESLTNNQRKVMRAFLLSSQLSVTVKSHELKCMVIRKQDKVYFGESIKKIFDERVSQYEFRDLDRPMREVV